jgi:hypothetical protein
MIATDSAVCQSAKDMALDEEDFVAQLWLRGVVLTGNGMLQPRFVAT